MTDDQATVEDVATVLRRRWKRLGALTGIAVLLLGGAFAGGYVTADDREKVDDLSRELATARDEIRASESEVDSLSDENQALEGDLEEAKRRLEAELNLNGKASSNPTATGASLLGDLEIGQAGKAGAFTLKPTTFERVESLSDGYETTTPDEGTVFYKTRITVKNDGQASASPFCSGGGQLIDDSDRQYDAESLLSEDTANCEDIQPGAQKDNFEVYFQVPVAAKPQTMILTGEDFSGDDDGTAWDVR